MKGTLRNSEIPKTDVICGKQQVGGAGSASTQGPGATGAERGAAEALEGLWQMEGSVRFSPWNVDVGAASPWGRPGPEGRLARFCAAEQQAAIFCWPISCMNIEISGTGECFWGQPCSHSSAGVRYHCHPLPPTCRPARGRQTPKRRRQRGRGCDRGHSLRRG